jgi:hypothetical protein
MPAGVSARSKYSQPAIQLLKDLEPPRAKHNQGFDGTTPVTEVSVDLKIDVQRVGLILCKNGLGAAYRAWV